MKASEMKDMGEEELRSKLVELRKELIKHNAQIATGTTPKSPGQVRTVRKTVARIKTMLNQRRKPKHE